VIKERALAVGDVQQGRQASGDFPRIHDDRRRRLVVAARRPCRTGMMVLFPSYSPHQCLSHQGERRHISIAFNLRKEAAPMNVRLAHLSSRGA
jgi:hypothetical protein